MEKTQVVEKEETPAFQALPLHLGADRKEFYFHVYFHEILDGSKNTTETVIIQNSDSPKFGKIGTMDVPLWSDLNEKTLIARMQGVALQSDDATDGRHLTCSIEFELPPKLKGSSLQVMGRAPQLTAPMEFAIVGGTGVFTLAQGVIYGRRLSSPDDSIWIELKINGYYTPMQRPPWNGYYKVGPCGGGSGLPEKEMDITGITRIVKIDIRHGNSIDALTITYERNGKVESTERWGREGGCLIEIDLQPSEYITCVSGHIASWGSTSQVRSLKLETNMKNYGPYGTQEGVPFELPSFGGRIIGFFARAGSMLEAIGVFVTDIMGNVWSPAKPVIYKAGPCGSGRTVPEKHMKNITDITRIVKIGIRRENSINALVVSYERNDKIITERWGKDVGNLTEVNLQPNEYITHVSGYVGSWENTLKVRSLKLQTNLKTYGPYGTQEGVPFELPAVGGRIMGFFARAGTMLEAIGVYIKAGGTTDTGGTAGTWSTSENSFWDRPE